MNVMIAFVIGILFSVGLVISNLTNPNKILNFLDITGHWDPTLLVVMIGALIPTFIGFRLIKKLKSPVFDNEFHLPQKKELDKPLIIGAVIFGIGWGVSGYCPGPSIAALATFNMDPVYFVVGMIAGSLAYFGWFR